MLSTYCIFVDVLSVYFLSSEHVTTILFTISETL